MSSQLLQLNCELSNIFDKHAPEVEKINNF